MRLTNLGTPPSPPRKPSRRHPRALGLTNTLFSLPTDANNIWAKLMCSRPRPCRRSCSLASTAQSNTRWNGLSVSECHSPRAIRQSGYFNTKTTWHGRHSSVAGHGIEHWRIAATLSTGQTTTAHQACPGVNTLVHSQVGELSSPFASPFRLVICSNLASLSHIPYHKPPLRIAYPVQEQDSKPKGRSSPLPLAANTLHTLYLQTCSHNGLRLD